MELEKFKKDWWLVNITGVIVVHTILFYFYDKSSMKIIDPTYEIYYTSPYQPEEYRGLVVPYTEPDHEYRGGSGMVPYTQYRGGGGRVVPVTRT